MTNQAITQIDYSQELKEFILGVHPNTPISDTQFAFALRMAKDYWLSPLRREIHFLPFYNSATGKQDLQPVIAYTEYLKKAQMTWNLNWYKYEIGVEWDWDNRDMRCKVFIYRKDREYPLEHTVRYKEVAQKNKNGEYNNNRKNKPKFMIMKVWIAQAMRLAFPEDLSAMPYEEAEARNIVDTKIKEIQEDNNIIAEDTWR